MLLIENYQDISKHILRALLKQVYWGLCLRKAFSVYYLLE